MDTTSELGSVKNSVRMQRRTSAFPTIGGGLQTMTSFGAAAGKKTPKLDIDVSKDDDEMSNNLKKTKSVTN